MSVTAQEREAPGTARDTGTAQAYAPGAGRRLGSRGRHRRPRSRKALLAAGGLALAAGVLSLMRPAPDSAAPRLGAADPGRPGVAVGTRGEPEHATSAAATLPARGRPGTAPSAPSPTGGAAAPAATGTSAPSTIPPRAPRPGASADAPGDTPAPPRTPGTPVPGATRPRPPAPAPPAPGQGTTRPPAPAPTASADTPVCLPVIGLCVNVPLPKRH